MLNISYDEYGGPCWLANATVSDAVGYDITQTKSNLLSSFISLVSALGLTQKNFTLANLATTAGGKFMAQWEGRWEEDGGATRSIRILNNNKA